MDSLPAATSFARALLVLARARATGVLTVHGPGGDARLSLADGGPQALAVDDGDRHTLGDLLVAEGALDHEAHRRALDAGPPTIPIGHWLVRHGVASAPAVAHALRRQQRRRVAALLARPAFDFRFAAGSPAIGLEPLEEPVDVADLVLGGMRELAAGAGPARLGRDLGRGSLRLTALGERLLDRATLWPEEAALAQLLRCGRPVEVDDLLGAASHRPRALQALWALRLLHGVAPPGPDAVAYPLLLRKRRQLRARAGSSALLDLPESARGADARRALRRLAGRLHPDRFDADTPAPIRRASSEVMSALVAAEADLRSRS